MDVAEVLGWLRKRGTRRNIVGMARYGIVAKRVFGVPMSTLLALKKRIGTNQALSLALWRSGWYEARLLAALVGDPARVTRRQMNAWASGFENWADCDTVCFQLFDKTPLAWSQVRPWSRSPREFVKRAAFALIASLALHAKEVPDGRFRPFLPIIERGARDGRNFVKKGVSWALRGVGRRSTALRAAARAVATRLARSADPSCRWVGNDALRDLVRRSPRAR